jgi:hypothetical protein
LGGNINRRTREKECIVQDEGRKKDIFNIEVNRVTFCTRSRQRKKKANCVRVKIKFLE